mgnify:CR=1 FL=1
MVRIFMRRYLYLEAKLFIRQISNWMFGLVLIGFFTAFVAYKIQVQTGQKNPVHKT